MRILRSLAISCCLLASIAPAVTAPADAVGPSWVLALRARVVRALVAMRGTQSGVLQVTFKVRADGGIADVHVAGPRRDSRKATAAVAAIGRVAPPPDHLAHPIAVKVRIR